MLQSLAPFAAAQALLDQGVGQLLSNATATWQGGLPFGVLHDVTMATDGFSGVATVTLHTVSLCTANTPGIAEGSTALTVDGKPCRITGAVVPDAGGWASFPIVFTGRPGQGG